MTTSGATRTYRYTADGAWAAKVQRVARARSRLVLLLLVPVGLVLGVSASMAVNVDALPVYLGRVLPSVRCGVSGGPS